MSSYCPNRPPGLPHVFTSKIHGKFFCKYCGEPAHPKSTKDPRG